MKNGTHPLDMNKKRFLATCKKDSYQIITPPGLIGYLVLFKELNVLSSEERFFNFLAYMFHIFAKFLLAKFPSSGLTCYD